MQKSISATVCSCEKS